MTTKIKQTTAVVDKPVENGKVFVVRADGKTWAIRDADHRVVIIPVVIDADV